MLKSAAILLLLGTTLVAEDSPLVALAKRTKREGSKVPVITNDTLSTSGRISVAGSSEPQAAPGDKTKTAATAQTAQAIAPVPATPVYTPSAPATAAPAAKEPNIPTTTARYVDPQSTATTIVPQSTLRTSDPTATLQYYTPPSTVNTMPLQSTAHSIAPQPSTPPQ